MGTSSFRTRRDDLMPSTLKKVVVSQFGGVENLQIVEEPMPRPGPGQVRIGVLSIGMNHADLMARRGEYRLSSGDPPFTPGLEAGGVIDAVGEGVTDRKVGQRVVVGPDVPRLSAGGAGGTYRTHYVCPANRTYLAPDNLPDEQLGAVWLAYLTAWGCLVWKHGLKAGAFVALPAASSSVALAAAQVARQCGAVTIGLTTSAAKVEKIKAIKSCAYDHLLITHDAEKKPTPWYKDIKRITADHGVDVFFDPVASGDYLNSEIRTLAQFGTIHVYGLLGEVGKVDVTPLIRKHAAIRGWALAEFIAGGASRIDPACQAILEGFAAGRFVQHVERVFRFEEVREAQAFMEEGRHIGKLVLKP